VSRLNDPRTRPLATDKAAVVGLEENKQGSTAPRRTPEKRSCIAAELLAPLRKASCTTNPKKEQRINSLSLSLSPQKEEKAD